MGKEYYNLGQRVELRDGRTGIIQDVPSKRLLYRVQFDDDGTRTSVYRSEISKVLPRTPVEFFDGQRKIVRRLLGAGEGKINDFESALKTISGSDEVLM
jgi:hypothetical protein